MYLQLKLKANSGHRRREVCCGFCFTKSEIGDVIDCRQSVNSSMARRMVRLDSRRRIGFFTTQKGKLMVVDEDIILVFLYNENGRRCFDLHRVNCCMAGWTTMGQFSV